MRARNTFLKAMVPLFCLAAGFHLWRAYSPNPGDPSGPVRHLVFVAINLLVAAFLWLRPAVLGVVFGLLVFQQVTTHGGAAWQAWATRGEIDYVSVAIVVLLPLTWGVLWHIASEIDPPS